MSKTGARSWVLRIQRDGRRRDFGLGSFRNAKHSAQWLSSLKTYAVPTLGKLPVDSIGVADVRDALLPIWLEKPEISDGPGAGNDAAGRFFHLATVFGLMPWRLASVLRLLWLPPVMQEVLIQLSE